MNGEAETEARRIPRTGEGRGAFPPRKRNRARYLVLSAGLLVALGGCLLGRGAYLWAKGRVAEHRIEIALDAYLEDGVPRRPWPWADFHPIARLEVPRLGESRSVIEGASGTSLAFAVGHVDGTAWPGERGNVVLAGHRDGAFHILSRLEVGDVLGVEIHAGSRRYVVDGTYVVRADDTRWLEPTSEDRLTLLTCYPFRSLGESGLRYVAVASAEETVDSTSEPVPPHDLE